MWLLESEALKNYESVKLSGVQPTDEQQKKFASLHEMGGDSNPRILSIAGNQAEISIQGIMTNTPDIMAMIFGGGNVTYPEIISALLIANNDSNVENISLIINSPGGEFVGLFDVLAQLQVVNKTIMAKVRGLAASGAYAIAAQADTITASNISTLFGSIGVAASIFVNENRVDIASTNAPKKRPNAKTLEGQSIIRSELDAMHEIFVESIATGRKTTVENVNNNFGQGGTLLAQKSFDNGMIDSIIGVTMPKSSETKKLILKTIEKSKPTASNSETQQRKKIMDLSTLKSQHSAIYAAAVQIGHDAGVKIGVEKERDRVNSHLVAGENCGELKKATAAIRDGSEMTQTLMAEYMTSGQNKGDAESREKDNVTVSSDSDSTDGIVDDDSEKVTSLVEKHFGVSGVA